MAVASFINPSTVVYVGPRDGTISYEWQIAASGGSVTDHQFVGPVYVVPGQGIAFTVSGTPSAGGTKPRATIYGTWDGPSITPSARDWNVVRADTATGTNILVDGTTDYTGMFKVLTPARSYRVRVSSATNGGVTSAVKVKGFIYSSQVW